LRGDTVGDDRAVSALHQPCTALWFRRSEIGQAPIMLMDILIALVIVAVAAALGLIVHPLLWLVLIVAVLWLFTRRGSWSSRTRV
jgi:hypothetical protein